MHVTLAVANAVAAQGLQLELQGLTAWTAQRGGEGGKVA